MDELLRDFLTESVESLTVIDGEMLKLEVEPNNRDALQKVFRLVHTIKGTCGFIGLPRLERVAHAAENVLGKFRDGVIPVTPGSVTLIFESLDRIKEILSGIERAESEPPGEDADLIERLCMLASSDASDNAGLCPTAPDVSVPLPPAPTTGPGPSPELADAAPSKAGELPVANQSIRVNVDVIEQLIVMVSELVLTRNQLLEMVRHTNDSEFKVPLQRLSNVTAELQESVMKTRMQPIGNAWAKLPRIVRDLGNELGKKIELQMHGSETELDRQVLELIKDPLTHMVRNSADHGLESPAERRAAGKPEHGTITLRAFHEGGHIIVQISDDGRGLPLDKIRAKALATGLVTEADLARMSETQIQRFVFHAGFSTAQKVTNVSGRGVGMDVVRSNIELIGGSIDLKSRVGHGTTFTIKIPLTMAIISALIVGVGDMRFAIPQTSVLELVRTSARSDTRIERINRTKVLRLRDRLLPLVRLSEVLRTCSAEAADPTEAYIVVTQAAGQTFGIVVDSVFDTGEIVVKPVCSILEDIPVFSGNTILGDGSVIMILDPNGVAAAVSGEVGTRSVTEDVPDGAIAHGEAKQSLLLFRAGSPEPKAVLLGAVTRLEMVDVRAVERADGRHVLLYRGQLIPVITSLAGSLRDEGHQPILVFSEGNKTAGVAVDEILDIVDETLTFELVAARSGVIGTSVIKGRATEVIDIAYHVSDVFRSWFTKRSVARTRPNVLLVDDSPFFRTMIAPLLMAAGYDVTEAGNAATALKLMNEGRPFDIIVSDISMPGMDGQQFAATVKRDPGWRETPCVGLAADPDAHEPGVFDVLARKFDREALVQTIDGIIHSQECAA